MRCVGQPAYKEVDDAGPPEYPLLAAIDEQPQEVLFRFEPDTDGGSAEARFKVDARPPKGLTAISSPDGPAADMSRQCPASGRRSSGLQRKCDEDGH